MDRLSLFVFILHIVAIQNNKSNLISFSHLQECSLRD